jgi:hypothetical protein
MNIENPIQNIGKRNREELKNILETLKFSEIVNNEFTEKYQIFLEKNKIITGYVVDYIMSTTNKELNFDKKSFEFLFVDVENNFYFFEFTDFYSIIRKSENIEYFCYKRNKNLPYNCQFLNSASLTIQNKYNNLFDKFDICGPTNLKLVFDFNLGKEKSGNFEDRHILNTIKQMYEYPNVNVEILKYVIQNRENQNLMSQEMYNKMLNSNVLLKETLLGKYSLQIFEHLLISGS